MKGLERRSCGSTLEVEEHGGVGTQRTECSGNQQAELFLAQATRNVGGAEAKNKVEELLAELADLGIARDGERSERIVAEEEWRGRRRMSANLGAKEREA